MTAAAISAATVTGLTGGNLGQILRAGAVAGATALAFFGVGEITGHTPAFGSPAYAANIAGHAGVSCLSAVASGGQCGPNALAAAAGAAAAPLISGPGGLFPNPQGNTGDLIGGTAATGLVGGLASVAGGGKFENGAVTAAFGYLYNFCGYKGCFDRRFNWADAVDHWRNGNGTTVTDVDVSELNLKDATYAKNPNGSYLIHTSQKYDTGVTYGTVTAILNSDGTMSLKPDSYNFDFKNPFSASTVNEVSRLIIRDAATAAGLIINGPGTGYRLANRRLPQAFLRSRCARRRTGSTQPLHHRAGLVAADRDRTRALSGRVGTGRPPGKRAL